MRMRRFGLMLGAWYAVRRYLRSKRGRYALRRLLGRRSWLERKLAFGLR